MAREVSTVPSITTFMSNSNTSSTPIVSRTSPTSSPKSGVICPKCDSYMTVSFMYIGKICSKCKHEWEVLPPPASISLK